MKNWLAKGSSWRQIFRDRITRDFQRRMSGEEDSGARFLFSSDGGEEARRATFGAFRRRRNHHPLAVIVARRYWTWPAGGFEQYSFFNRSDPAFKVKLRHLSFNGRLETWLEVVSGASASTCNNSGPFEYDMSDWTSVIMAAGKSDFEGRGMGPLLNWLEPASFVCFG